MRRADPSGRPRCSHDGRGCRELEGEVDFNTPIDPAMERDAVLIAAFGEHMEFPDRHFDQRSGLYRTKRVVPPLICKTGVRMPICPKYWLLLSI